MRKLLSVEVSPNGSSSGSRAAAKHLIERLKRANSGLTTISRDLAAQPVPHVTSALVGTYFTPAESRTAEQKELVRLSDTLVDELLAADIIVISTPMWNFSMPSVLKAWIDHVIRAGRTFNYTVQGPQGLVNGKKVYLVMSSGGVFSSGPAASYDQLSPALKTQLGFIGLTNTEIIRVEGTNSPDVAKDAVPRAIAMIDKVS